MKLTIIHPCIGKRKGEPYIKLWEMEPLPPAMIAGLTPKDVEIAFYDDRIEPIPYDEPTDLVAISVETYTAKRAYQIATEYRKRGVPVVMGGFHATLVPEEVSEYAEAVVIGEAEGVWEQVIDDARRHRLQRYYKLSGRPSLERIQPDRSIFQGKRYLPLRLIEAGRGCHFKCDFCAIQTYFNSTQTRRPWQDIVSEIETLRDTTKLFFFVDDNVVSNMEQAKELFRALIPLNIKWVGQGSITCTHDEEFMQLLRDSGCQGLLIGFESLNPANLKAMQKGFNTAKGGFLHALQKFKEYGLILYATFVFGYDEDVLESFEETVHFAIEHDIYIVSFNHLTPFPGTPLYKRLEQEGRLLYEKWWLDDRYRYGDVPFLPRRLSPDTIREKCVESRKRFYSFPSIWKRSLARKTNARSFFLWRNFFMINLMFKKEATQREGYPLGDEAFVGPLLKANHPISKTPEEAVIIPVS
ncbi:B12-binding domain-containing radical SAM protein [Brevibacillus sp. H7]|uniref:B12-binding domain-containing radical SAM protein n=1 Tax=Brevibacillus sp. H7 TaxID=3349138 RepID=UPI0037F23E0F